MIHVCLGTKAQYIKTAPLLWRMDREGVPYRLIDLGQHGTFSRDLRRQINVRQPDVFVGGDVDIATIPAAFGWTMRLLRKSYNRRFVRQHVFGGHGGVCVVHGDTPSTLLSTLMARRAGLRIAHLEAGLRSRSLLHPFPEEIIRVLVMKRADYLFAPDATAESNLNEMAVAGEIIPTHGNTISEMVVQSGSSSETGKAIVTCHRVENLHSRSRLSQLVSVVQELSKNHDVLFVMHPPTEQALQKRGLLASLQATVETVPLLPHQDFVEYLSNAPLVITDGGSIQEECAIVGTPTLLWRARTERRDGLGSNVVLSRYDQTVIEQFLAQPERWRAEQVKGKLSPSAIILERLLEGTSSNDDLSSP